MKSTVSVIKSDELNRGVLASETHNTFYTDQKDRIEMFTEGNTIVFRKCAPPCAICNAAKDTTHYKGKLICQDCIDVIKEIAGR
jgi:transcriptional pleiotropic regulator of transition state genes